MSEMAFSGITVLDCSEGIAGGYCAKLFADYGAEVIKIEKPGKGDSTRNIGPFLDDDNNSEKSGLFFYLNTNKKSITLNLENKAGREILNKLVINADILIESFKPGTMAAWGLSYEILEKLNPKLIMTSITGSGQTGPYRDYQINNLIAMALAGVMYTSRPADNTNIKPVLEGGRQAEYVTGLLSFTATSAALVNRLDTHKGTWIDMSMLECVASTMGSNITEYSYIGLSRKTNPYAIHGYPIGYSYPCKDGWISLTPGLGGTPDIPLLIERPDLLDHPLFTNPRERMGSPEKFDEIVTPWLEQHGKWEITELAQELKLAFTPVLAPSELLADEQLKERNFFIESNHPAMGKVVYPGASAKSSEPIWRKGVAPLLGEHNDAVYTKLGFSKEELNDFNRRGII